jgi:hypothetical protein
MEILRDYGSRIVTFEAKSYCSSLKIGKLFRASLVPFTAKT